MPRRQKPYEIKRPEVSTATGSRPLNYNVRQHETMAELCIDRGKDAGQENLEIFGALEGHKEDIEQRFGGPLSWQPLEGKRACRIRGPVNEGGYRDPEDRWPPVQNSVIEQMIRLESALGPH